LALSDLSSPSGAESSYQDGKQHRARGEENQEGEARPVNEDQRDSACQHWDAGDSYPPALPTQTHLPAVGLEMAGT
jgi:hypothetical protein